MALDEKIMNMILDRKVPLGDILDLCPRFKKKVLKKWMLKIGKEIKELEEEAPCNMAQPKELPRGMTMWQRSI